MNYCRKILAIVSLTVVVASSAVGQLPLNFKKQPDIQLPATDGTAFGCGGYWEWLPSSYNLPENASKKYPLIIFLGGNSEGGSGSSTDLDNMIFGYTSIPTYSGLASLCASGLFPETVVSPGGTSYSFMVMSLQCFPGTGILPKHIEPYIDYFINNYRVDPARIFLTGVSIGGTRVWTTAGTNKATSTRFAAVIPIDGGADGNYVNCPHPEPLVACTGNASMYNMVISNLDDDDAPKTLAIHGVEDFNRYLGASFVSGINRPGNAAIRWTPGGHGSWRATYHPDTVLFSNLTLYQWMLAQADLLLPVTLTSFDALARGSEIQLTWSTESESNSSHFAVERSSNGRDFQEIGRVKSSGNSTTKKNYSFTDKTPRTGKNFYRLKMVDLDATFKYSEVRTVSTNGSDLEFSFGPNPVQNEASIRISGSQRVRLTLTVTDLMGRTLKTMNIVKSENLLSQKIGLSDLPAGQYVLSIKGENVNYMQRLVKR
jgi:predicted peptidase